MPRLPKVFCSESFYHLSARTNNRDWFAIPMPIVWRIMSDYLFFIHHAFDVQILSFVLMENHFHLIAKFPSGNMSVALQYFMRETSRCIAGSSHRINHVYGSRVFRSLIHSDNYLHHAYKYVYRNPVQAGIAGKVEDYRYSTLRLKLGLDRDAIPLCGDEILFGSETARVLEWLNRSPSIENFLAVKSAIRRREMRLPRRKSKRPHFLEGGIY